MTRHAIRGALLNAEGQTEEEARKAGRVFFPSSSKIASTHLVPKVLLAHSHGVYLITNAELEGSPASRDTVAYAQGMNQNWMRTGITLVMPLWVGLIVAIPFPLSGWS